MLAVKRGQGLSKMCFKFHKNMRKDSHDKSPVIVALSPQSVTAPRIR